MKRSIKFFILAALMIICLGKSGICGAKAADDRQVTIPEGYAVNDATQGDARDGDYDAFFPKDSLQEVRLYVDEEELKYLFDHAIKKPSVLADSITIGGSTVSNVGLKTKGDYTLDHGVSDNDSNRYAFTVNFGKYIKKDKYGQKQNFYGLKKVCFNNLYFDKSMLKEYCAYTLFAEMGVPSSQFCLTRLYINDEYYGVYFMMEGLDHSILMRHYGMKKKDLGAYLAKPDDTDLEYDDVKRDPSVLYNNDEDVYEDVKVDLDLVTESVRKLDALSRGRDFDGAELDTSSDRYLELLDTVIDTDEFLRYFAVQSFLVQTDNMFTEQHNYGLYCDRNGRLSLIPWDYDLSFGTYFPTTADMTANYDVDIMYRMNESWQDYNNSEHAAGYYSNYPLFNVIYQNEALMEKYHSYMMDCARIYALGGRTTDNKTYEPAYMTSLINTISDELIEAATEKTADTASYMNFIWQPKDVIKALPNIKQIITDRAVGVYSQLSGLGSWISCGDCDLSAVGNGQKGKGRSKGFLSVTDPDTGIFATAQYNGGKPSLTVKKYEPGEYEWNTAKEQLGDALDLTVYDLSDQGEFAGSYMVTIPASSTRLKAGTKLVLYSADEDGVHALETSRNGNLYSASLTAPGRIILAQVNDLPEEDTEKEDESVFNRDTLIVAGIGLGMLLLAVVIIELVQRAGKKKSKKQQDKQETQEEKQEEKQEA